MTHTELFLGKTFDLVEYSDIELFFIEPKTETYNLEFKSGGVDKKEIIKVVNAFLNSDGGLIIIGAPKESGGMCVGSLTDASKHGDYDKLSRSIHSSITPLPKEIRIKFLEKNGNTIIIVLVEKSLYPPHQVIENGVYYMRLETQTVPAPHSFVYSMMNQRKSSNIEVSISSIELLSSNPRKYSTNLLFTNSSEIPTQFPHFIIDIFNVYEPYIIEDGNVIKFSNNVEKNRGINLNKYTYLGKIDSILVPSVHNKFRFIFFNRGYSGNIYFRISVWSELQTISKFYFSYSIRNEEIEELTRDSFFDKLT